MNDLFTKEDMIEYFEAYKNICNITNNINKKFPKGHKKIRRINFPSEISENICKIIGIKYFNKEIRWNTKCGDLITSDNEKIEVKAFSSNGPISFGPKENWDHLIILDALDYINGNFKCYYINLSNTNEIWKNIKVSKTQTYKEQCDKGRRPRINWETLYPQIKEHVELIFEGNICNI